MELIDRLERVGTVLGLADDREAVLLEEHPRTAPEARVVVDDQDRRAAVHGRIVSDVSGVRGVANRTGLPQRVAEAESAATPPAAGQIPEGARLRSQLQRGGIGRLRTPHSDCCALRGGIAIEPRVARLCRDVHTRAHADDGAPFPRPGPRRPRALRERRRVDAASRRRPRRGARVTDVDGRVFVDFAGGIGCQNTRPPVRAGRRGDPRAGRPVPAPVLHGRHVRAVRRGVPAARGAVALPGAEQKSILVNSGAEAIENAVKIARAATGRPAVIVFDHAFHGRTLLTMTMTSKVHPYKPGFGPFAPEVYRAPAPYPYRGVTTDDAIARARGSSSSRTSTRRPWPASCSSPSRARAASSPMPPDFPARLARALRRARDPLRRRRGAVRRRAHRERCGRSSTTRASSPTCSSRASRSAAGSRSRPSRAAPS